MSEYFECILIDQINSYLNNSLLNCWYQDNHRGNCIGIFLQANIGFLKMAAQIPIQKVKQFFSLYLGE